MNTYIQNSLLFKGSKNKSSILAAWKNPINKELVQQIDDYVEYIKEPDGEIIEETPDKAKVKPSSGGAGGGSFSGGASFTDFEGSEFDEDFEGEDFESDEIDLDISDEDESEEIEVEDTEVESSTKITAGTYVTIDSVAQAVNEIPGTLNLKEDTCGVTHSILKGGTDNEVWIYYNSDKDINSVLDSVNKTLSESGFYFLEFNRVARNENAIVFSISWVSSYFDTTQVLESKDE